MDGISVAVGHPNLARFIGLKTGSILIQNAVAVSQGTSLNRREDWSRHYVISAVLAVMKHPITRPVSESDEYPITLDNVISASARSKMAGNS
jgi:hypothetical protein